MKRLLLLSIIVLMVSTAFAVAATTPTFQVTVANARTLRGEGQTEAIGQVGLQVVAAGTSGIGGAADSFSVSFSVPITESPTDLTTVIACALAATPGDNTTIGTLAACPAGFSATVSSSGVTIIVPNRVWTEGERIVIQNIRVDASGVSGAITAFVSANTLGVSLTGVTQVFVGNVVKPSLSAALTTGGAQQGPINLTTCNLAGSGESDIDVTENFAQAFTTAAQEKAFTPALAVTNGTEIQVIVSGVPAGFTVIGGNSTNAGAAATFLGASLASGTSLITSNGGKASGGSGDVVLTWEITGADQTQVETVTLPIFVASNGTLTPVGNPASITARVRLAPVTGTAPLLTNGALAAVLTAAGVPPPFNVDLAAITSGVVGSGATSATQKTIVRFVDNTVKGGLALGTVSDCVTTLLFPFVVANTAGFDTSIALINSSADTLETAHQSGTCTLVGFPSDLAGKSTGAQFTILTTPSIDAGGVYATALGTQSSISAGFTGYAIATCNFLYAKGYTIITNGFNAPASQPVSHGYLALTINGKWPSEGDIFRGPNGKLTPEYVTP